MWRVEITPVPGLFFKSASFLSVHEGQKGRGVVWGFGGIGTENKAVLLLFFQVTKMLG